MKIRKFLEGIEQAANLGHRCEALEKENADLRDKNSSLWDAVKKHSETSEKFRKEVEELKGKVRSQTEADLVLTSLKIIQGAVRGETKEQLSPLANLQAQQMHAMQNVAPYYGQGQAFGLGSFGLGL